MYTLYLFWKKKLFVLCNRIWLPYVCIWDKKRKQNVARLEYVRYGANKTHEILNKNNSIYRENMKYLAVFDGQMCSTI